MSRLPGTLGHHGDILRHILIIFTCGLNVIPIWFVGLRSCALEKARRAVTQSSVVLSLCPRDAAALQTRIVFK